MNEARDFRDEGGFSLPELLVAMSIGVIVLFGVLAVVQTTSSSSARTTARVTANQTARPAMAKIIDELHSSCISPDLAPIQTGSTDDSITFIYSTDRGVTPVPEKRTISLASGIISETVYPYVSGSAPTWVFSGTGTTTRMVTNVVPATLGAPESTVPLFRYYAYDTSTATVSTTPLATPLDATEAASAVQVTVSFAIKPNKNTVQDDPEATVSLSDTALLRFTPASATAGESLLPCA